MTRIEQVARLLSGGATYKQIMDQLGIPYSSVTAYVTKARQAGLLPVSKFSKPKVWPEMVVVRVVLDHAEWDALDRMAADAGIAPIALARRIIVAVLDDDAAAHGAAPSVPSEAGGGTVPAQTMIERVLLMGGAGCDAEAIAARLKISVATVRRIADAWATERDARDG